MKPSILLVVMEIGTSYRGFYIGVGSLAAVLKKAGYRVELFRAQQEQDLDILIETVRASRPLLIGFSVMTIQWPWYKRFISALYHEFSDPIPIIIGGLHATTCPEEVVHDPSVTILCIGEGEGPLLELVQCLENDEDYTAIKNLWVKSSDGQIIRNPSRELIADLDALPWPDQTSFFPVDTTPHLGTLEVMTGRGCPYKCTYCANHLLARIFKGKGRYVRRRSVESVILELEHFTSLYSVSVVSFQDDTFTLNKRWLRQFAPLYAERIGLPYMCNVRIETLDDETLELLKQTGPLTLIIGIESGSEWLRFNVMNRKMTNQRIIEAFERIRRHGIRTAVFYMVGLPFETPGMVQETLALHKQLKPDSFGVSIFYPYPHTDLWKVCCDEGFLSERVGQLVGSKISSVLDLPTLSQEAIEGFYHQFTAIQTAEALSQLEEFYDSSGLKLTAEQREQLKKMYEKQYEG